jgi:PAS domain S-box-containing protein
MIVRWKPGGYRTFVNKAYCETFDLDPKEAISKSFFPNLAKSFLKDFREDIEKLTPGNPVRSYKVHNPLPNGKNAWQEWSDRAYFDREGNAIEYQSVGRDITVQKELEIQRQLVSERLKAISDNVPGIVFRYKINPDLSDELVFVSDGVQNILGISPEDALSDINIVWSQFHPDDIEHVRQTIKESYEIMTRWYAEWRIYLANGGVGWVQGTGDPKKLEDGSVIWDSVILDITEQMQIKKELEKNENLFRSIVQDQDEMIVRWKPGGVRTFVNKAYLDFYNLKEDQVIGTSFFDLISPEDQDRVKKEIEALTPENPARDKVHSVVLPDGAQGWQKWKDRAFFDESGNPVEYQSVGIDITLIIEAEKALEESEARYRNVFNQQFQFTALLDLEGKVVLINDLPLQIQDLSREDYTGKLFWESPGWKGNKEWEKKVKSQILFTKKTREPLIVEDPYYGANKEVRWAKAAYSTIQNSEGEIENILVQAIDITAEKTSKKEIAEREKKLNNIFNVTSDILVLIRADDGYLIEEVNDAFLTLSTFFGKQVTRELAVGKSIEWLFRDLINISDKEIRKRYEKYEKVCETKERITYTQRLDKEGRTLITEMVLSPLIQDHKVTHILIRLADITEQELAKIQLQDAYSELSALKESIEQENIYLKEEIKHTHDFENMVFKSAEFRNVLNKVEQVAKTDATVLITGETGTGKELIARAIHNTSKRAEKPMIKVNAAAIPKDLIESELFGYEKGAFTGATSQKSGKFELADGGSIFLDEIGDMPLDLQVKILRVLQEGEVERLGSTSSKKINVRIITATNRKLEQAAKDGKFREDLYFRLNVFPIEIPPLRSRPDDVPILVEHFIAKYNTKHSKQIKSISKSVMDYMRNYAWPGNVRELENIVERAVILSPAENLELPEIVDSTETKDKWEHGNSLDVIQENHIRKVLAECHWKIEGNDGAAAQLKIKPSTLRDKMKKFKIKRPQ